MDSDDSFLARVAASPALQPPPTPHQGTLRFELRRRIGAGSFGEVFEARDRESGAVIAVKVLRAGGPDRLFRFKREFRSVADIAHPNLVRLYELIHEDDRWYLTMELIDGLPFAEHLRRAPEQLRAAFAQLAQAIDALHRARCLHRDIKLTNVLVERSGRVVLLDFGLALALEAQGHTAIAGTPHYMAPEQLSGGELTEACDWYAFGVMLYHSLAGVLPFDAPSERLRQAKREPPRSPSTLRQGVDPQLERLCMRLLSVEPRDRPTAAEVLEALSASEASEDGLARDAEPFAGRARELGILRERFRSVTDRGALVLVGGQAGIGKTSLVHAFGREVAAAQGLVFAGRCHEAESVPFKGVDAIVDAVSEYLRRQPAIDAAALLPRGSQALATMFPVLKRVDAFAQLRRHREAAGGPLEARRAALDALRELIARLSDTAPLLVLVDDLQWATDDGVRLLLDLVAPPTPPALFVITYRKEAVGRTPVLDRFLAGVTGAPTIAQEILELSPLTTEEVVELMALETSGTRDGEEAWRETGGHPFFLTRVLRANAGKGAEVGLSTILDEQFRGLGAAARRVLELVSLSAADLTQGAACAAAGLPAWDPLVIDELRLGKLARSDGRSARAAIEPYHDQVRERLLDTLSVEHRRRLHLDLARFLEENRRADAVAVAHHYAEAGDRERASDWMRRAALAASESLAFARAAELYGRAAELSRDPAERVDRMVEHAEAMVLAGRRGDAGRTCLDACSIAARAALDERVAALRALAAEHLMLGGDFARGTALLREALLGVGVKLPDSAPVAVAETLNQNVELVARGLDFERRSAEEVSPHALRRVDLELSAARSLAQSDIRAPWIAARALRDALELGVPERAQRALAYFTFVNAPRLAHHPLGEEVLTMAEALGRDLQDDVGLAWAVMGRGYLCLYRREVESALALFRDAERRFLTLSRPLMREAGMARVGLVTACGSYGADLPFALAMSHAWIAEALEREDMTPVTWLRLMSVWLDLAADDVAAAREKLRLAREAWSSVEDEIFIAVSLLAELAITVYADPEAAWKETERLGIVFHRMFASMMPTSRLAFYRQRGSAAICAYHAGLASREQTADRVAGCIEALASNPNAAETLPQLRAYASMLKGDPGLAARLFEEAAAGFGKRHQRMHQLLALLRAAQARGGPTDALIGELVALGVVAPDRYGLIFVGPSPVRPRAVTS